MPRKKCVIGWKIPWRLLALLAVLLMAMSLVPILWIAKYNVPCADDYSYGLLTRHAWTETHSLLQVLKASFRQVKNTYVGWQGTWSAVWLMSLQPAVISERLYPLSTVMMLASLLGGLYCFLRVLVVRVVGESRSKCLVLWAATGTACLQFMPSASQGLYWFNGSVFYTFFFGIFLLCCGLAVRYVTLSEGAKRWGTLAVLSVSMLFLSGGNYAICLLTSELWVLYELALICKKNKRWMELLLPAVLFFAGFAVNAAAPGNAVRQSRFLDHPGVLEAIRLSLSRTYIYSSTWLTAPVLLLLLLLFPVLWSMTENKTWSFRCPGLVTGLSFCLLSSMNTPALYAMGFMGDGRYIDIVYYALILLAVFNIYYWMGWFRRKIQAPEQRTKGMEITCAAVLSALILVSVEILPSVRPVTSLSAWDSLRSGEAWEYYETFQQRQKILQNEDEKDVLLPAFPTKPYVLFFDDITPNADDWRNSSMAQFYQKNSVIRENE